MNSKLSNNQCLGFSSSSEINNIIHKGEVMFKKSPIVALSDVSRLINSAIMKRQGDQRKHTFLEKKEYCIKGKMYSL